MTGAQTLDVEKLTKLLGMLGSAHDGEIAAAGRAADRLVRKAGLRWPDVLRPALPPPPHEREFADIDDAIEFALEEADVLTDWEVTFLKSLRRRRKSSISEKQQDVLDRLIEKANRARHTEARAA